jgi:hypothetical protein
MSKFGLINAEYRPTDWFFGGFNPLHDRKTWQIDGNWERYLPVVEYQNKHGFDRMACVSYSLLNCLEVQYARQTGKEINWSDRALAKMSGTEKWGNRLDTVFDTARHKGLVLEALWPDTDGGWDEYYKTIPSTIFSTGEAFLSEFSLYREWVSPYRLDMIREALKEAPLQVTVKYASGNGLLNPKGTPDHAACLYNISDGFEIFDHYLQTRKKYSLDYQFGNVLKPLLIKKTLTIMNINNNALVFKTQGAGYNFGIMIDGKLLIGKTDDVIGVWTMRNKDFSNKVSVTLEDWDKLIHYDLKGNKI